MKFFLKIYGEQWKQLVSRVINIILKVVIKWKISYCTVDWIPYMDQHQQPVALNTVHLCFGLAVIFFGNATQRLDHSEMDHSECNANGHIDCLKLHSRSLIKWIEWGILWNDLFCVRLHISEVDTLLITGNSYITYKLLSDYFTTADICMFPRRRFMEGLFGGRIKYKLCTYYVRKFITTKSDQMWKFFCILIQEVLM